MTLKILWLYAKNMNIYGDYGNILAIKKRAKIYGVKTEIIKYNLGDDFPEEVDIIVGGGGQDSGQNQIQGDLTKIGPKLKILADNNTPMIVVCGLYQLFGDFFETQSGQKIKGIEIFKGVKTYGGAERLIGNIVEESEEFGKIIGYENHSGQTYLSNDVKPLARVVKGEGNNIVGSHEGAKYRNVIGTYLHGSILPKNPRITDFLIKSAIRNKGEKVPDILDSEIANFKKLERLTSMARKLAIKRPR